MRGVTLRIEGSEGTIVVISTKIVESATTTVSVIVATKLPCSTPYPKWCASQTEAGSIRSWLKKKGRSSVGADKSRGYFATASLSPCGVVAPMISDKVGDLVCDCGRPKYRSGSSGYCRNGQTTWQTSCALRPRTTAFLEDRPSGCTAETPATAYR